jgi:protein-tyrosine phosphatase
MLQWKRDGVDTVLSLLEPAEANELDLSLERDAVRNHGMDFLSIPIQDRNVPASRLEFTEQLERVERELDSGRNVVLHCRQGIGRTGLVAATLLMMRGMSPAAAVARLSAARGIPVPETPEQRLWLENYAATFALTR